MAKRDNEGCAYCRFFDHFGTGFGECRRYAPRLSDGTGNAQNHEKPKIYAVWPITGFGYWCGEFEPDA